jgi:hypothetical protein
MAMVEVVDRQTGRGADRQTVAESAGRAHAPPIICLLTCLLRPSIHPSARASETVVSVYLSIYPSQLTGRLPSAGATCSWKT